MQRAFWISFAAASAVYLVMVLWSIPVITKAAGGIAPFDMRLTGYTVAEAKSFLTALSEDGRQFYLKVQLRLDLIYPALLGILLVIGYQRVYRAPWTTVFSCVAMVMVSADYLENYMVATMLQTEVGALDENVVTLASFWTMCKAAAATVAFGALLWGAVARMRRSWA